MDTGSTYFEDDNAYLPELVNQMANYRQNYFKVYNYRRRDDISNSLMIDNKNVIYDRETKFHDRDWQNMVELVPELDLELKKKLDKVTWYYDFNQKDFNPDSLYVPNYNIDLLPDITVEITNESKLTGKQPIKLRDLIIGRLRQEGCAFGITTIKSILMTMCLTMSNILEMKVLKYIINKFYSNREPFFETQEQFIIKPVGPALTVIRFRILINSVFIRYFSSKEANHNLEKKFPGWFTELLMHQLDDPIDNTLKLKSHLSTHWLSLGVYGTSDEIHPQYTHDRVAGVESINLQYTSSYKKTGITSSYIARVEEKLKEEAQYLKDKKLYINKRLWHYILQDGGEQLIKDSVLVNMCFANIGYLHGNDAVSHVKNWDESAETIANTIKTMSEPKDMPSWVTDKVDLISKIDDWLSKMEKDEIYFPNRLDDYVYKTSMSIFNYAIEKKYILSRDEFKIALPREMTTKSSGEGSIAVLHIKSDKDIGKDINIQLRDKQSNFMIYGDQMLTPDKMLRPFILLSDLVKIKQKDLDEEDLNVYMFNLAGSRHVPAKPPRPIYMVPTEAYAGSLPFAIPLLKSQLDSDKDVFTSLHDDEMCSDFTLAKLDGTYSCLFPYIVACSNGSNLLLMSDYKSFDLSQYTKSTLFPMLSAFRKLMHTNVIFKDYTISDWVNGWTYDKILDALKEANLNAIYTTEYSVRSERGTKIASYVYSRLMQILQSGQKYTITLNNITNKSNTTMAYDCLPTEVRELMTTKMIDMMGDDYGSIHQINVDMNDQLLVKKICDMIIAVMVKVSGRNGLSLNVYKSVAREDAFEYIKKSGYKGFQYSINQIQPFEYENKTSIQIRAVQWMSHMSKIASYVARNGIPNKMLKFFAFLYSVNNSERIRIPPSNKDDLPKYYNIFLPVENFFLSPSLGGVGVMPGFLSPVSDLYMMVVHKSILEGAFPMGTNLEESPLVKKIVSKLTKEVNNPGSTGITVTLKNGVTKDKPLENGMNYLLSLIDKDVSENVKKKYRNLTSKGIKLNEGLIYSNLPYRLGDNVIRAIQASKLVKEVKQSLYSDLFKTSLTSSVFSQYASLMYEMYTYSIDELIQVEMAPVPFLATASDRISDVVKLLGPTVTANRSMRIVSQIIRKIINSSYITIPLSEDQFLQIILKNMPYLNEESMADLLFVMTGSPEAGLYSRQLIEQIREIDLFGTSMGYSIYGIIPECNLSIPNMKKFVDADNTLKYRFALLSGLMISMSLYIETGELRKITVRMNPKWRGVRHNLAMDKMLSGIFDDTIKQKIKQDHSSEHYYSKLFW